MPVKNIIKQLKSGNIDAGTLAAALNIGSEKEFMPVFEYSEELCGQNFGKDVFIRGIVEFTNNCRKDCKYCGIRRSNPGPNRYRMTPEEIIESAKLMHEQGVMTIVLQGGEDVKCDGMLLETIQKIKTKYDMAITISIGERSGDVYRSFRDAGADRFLLRIETTDRDLFRNLHPDDDFDHRMKCLHVLKETGFEVGTGIMLGLPGQTAGSIAQDLLFFREFRPEMVGIGPFLPHEGTPLKGEKGGSLFLTLKTMALVRILLPGANIPATTAMGTVDPRGREKALQYGANVIMPNYTPVKYRKDYMLYDKKICVSEMCARACTDNIVRSIGKEIVVSKGFSRLSGPVIRKACLSDFPGIKKVEEAVCKDTRRAGTIKKNIENGNCYAAFYGNKTAGFVTYDNDPDRGLFIELVLVHPDFQRRGCGKTLVSRVISDNTAPHISASAQARNKASIALFESMGFTKSAGSSRTELILSLK